MGPSFFPAALVASWRRPALRELSHRLAARRPVSTGAEATLIRSVTASHWLNSAKNAVTDRHKGAPCGRVAAQVSDAKMRSRSRVACTFRCKTVVVPRQFQVAAEPRRNGIGMTGTYMEHRRESQANFRASSAGSFASSA